MIDNLHIMTDEQLVKMAQEGSETASEILINKYKGLVKHKAKAYFIVGADQEDVVQEGMIGLFKAIRGYDGSREAGFATFAGICINHQILSAIRKAEREKNQILNESVPFSKAVETGPKNTGKTMTLEDLLRASMDEEPESKVIFGETVDALRTGGSILFSGLENKVWDLKLHGYDYKEIAEILDKSPKSIDNALQRIRKKIMECLK